MYALCLDSLYDPNNLRLQTSKDLTTDSKELLSKLTSAIVKDLGAIQVIESVDINKLIWQHNAVRSASRSTRAGTLTSIPPSQRPSNLNEKYPSVAFNPKTSSDAAISNAIAIADEIALILGEIAFPEYRIKETLALFDELYSSKRRLQEFSHNFGSFPRYAPILARN